MSLSGVCSKELRFFFSLLKRKKKQKKKRSRLPLFRTAMRHTKGNTIFVTHNINSPEGGTGGSPFFASLPSPFPLGDGLSTPLTVFPQRKSGFPHQFQHNVEKSCGEKARVCKSKASPAASPLWKPAAETVESLFHSLSKLIFPSHTHSTDFSTSFPFPLHNLSPFQHPAVSLHFPTIFTHPPCGKKVWDLRHKRQISTFPAH